MNQQRYDFGGVPQDEEDLSAPPPYSRFANQPTWQDLPWVIAFFVQFLVMCSVAGIFYKHISFSHHLDYIIPTTAISALVVAPLTLFLLQNCAECLIWTAILVGVASNALLGLLFLASGNIVGAVIFFLIAVLSVWWAFMIKDRIPFATALLKVSTHVAKLYPHTFTLAFLHTGIQGLWGCIWIVGALGVYQQLQQSSYAQPVLAFLVLSFYWTSQVVWNVVLVSVDGVFAEWFFKFPNLTPNPTYKSWQRAVTTSSGSICLGSFLIAAVKTLRYLVNQARRSENNMVLCLVNCILSCLENIMNYVNHYAYVYVAVYGRNYCDSAQSVFQLFESKGFDVIINDDLIGGVLTITSFIAALAVAAVNYFVTTYVLKLVDVAAYIGLGSVMGFVFTGCMLNVIHSGVSTILVCYAEDPSALAQSDPGAYQALTDAFYARFRGKVPMFR